MPYKSEAQMRWGNSPAGHKALGDAGVNEWNKATAGRPLPERASHRDYKATPKRRRKVHGPVI